MAKKKTRKSPQRIEYEREYKNLQRRLKYWEKTHKFLLTKTPKKATKNYAKETEKIKNIRYENLSQKQKEEYRINYEQAYEENKIEIPEAENGDFIPHSENDFLDNLDTVDNLGWSDTPNEPVDEIEEFSAEIDELIDEIVSSSDTERGREDVRDILKNLLENARNDMGDKDFYNFLKDTDALSKLQSAANEAIFKYIKKGQDYESQINSLLADFATILNMNRPLTDEQSFTLSAYGTINFDFE